MFSLALSLAYFWTGREEGGSWIVTVCLKSKMAGANTVSFTQKGLCKLQAHSKRRGVRNGDQMGTLYLECCKAKVHLLYVAYSKRMEHSIYLHMVTVIWIWGFLKSSGPLVLPADDFANGWLVWNSEGPSPLWRLSRDDPAKDRIHSIETDRLKLPDQPFLVVHGSELWRVAGQLGTHPRLQEWTV